ncbi:uncharacterized protein LOC141921082 [Strix aluco]|uniref:uncharacterized protein LOC141921082 n=1 Tax=Strix aluco TaxID=111821 RepID=UPI003DA3A8F3
MDPGGIGCAIPPRNWERTKGRGRGGGSASPPGPGERQGKHGQPDPLPTAAGARCLSWQAQRAEAGAPSRAQRRCPGPAAAPCMALVLGAVLLAAGAAVPLGLPPPRDLARSVLETHGQELKLLKVLGVTRTTFDWGTHFSINFTARQPACPKNLPARRGAGCHARPGRVQRCAAQVSVFAFLPDVPLSMVECGREPGEAHPYFSPQQPGSSTQPRSPGTPRAFSTKPGHPSSSSSRPHPQPRPLTGVSLPGTSRHPPSPADLE